MRKKTAEGILEKLTPEAGNQGRQERRDLIAELKATWSETLAAMDHEDDDPGTSWNLRAREKQPSYMSPRMGWRAIIESLPKEAIISSDIGNNCAIGNAYPTFESGRKYLAPGLFGPCGTDSRRSSGQRLEILTLQLWALQEMEPSEFR
ncbi:MAG: hypothetical protein CM15mP28_4540 [Pseudomonadota bacterium]|nr:MAG: hypothetical protein CM15mP28_4540 [Pseudomonadota bacterium]